MGGGGVQSVPGEGGGEGCVCVCKCECAWWGCVCAWCVSVCLSVCVCVCVRLSKLVRVSDRERRAALSMHKKILNDSGIDSGIDCLGLGLSQLDTLTIPRPHKSVVMHCIAMWGLASVVLSSSLNSLETSSGDDL